MSPETTSRVEKLTRTGGIPSITGVTVQDWQVPRFAGLHLSAGPRGPGRQHRLNVQDVRVAYGHMLALTQVLDDQIQELRATISRRDERITELENTVEELKVGRVVEPRKQRSAPVPV